MTSVLSVSVASEKTLVDLERPMFEKLQGKYAEASIGTMCSPAPRMTSVGTAVFSRSSAWSGSATALMLSQ